MNVLFYISGAIAVAASFLAVTRTNAVHALLYLIVSLLAAALVFFALGAPFAAALEVIIYAGAIMVLFIFVIMMLNLGARSEEQERAWLGPGVWRGPAVLCVLLLAELLYALARTGPSAGSSAIIDAKAVGIALYGPYVVAVELASMLLLAGLVGAYHLGRKEKE